MPSTFSSFSEKHIFGQTVNARESRFFFNYDTLGGLSTCIKVHNFFPITNVRFKTCFRAISFYTSIPRRHGVSIV